MGTFQTIQEKHEKQILHIITLEGELDMYSAPHLREILDSLIAEGEGTIILDCTQLVFIDSSGLGSLVGALKEVSNGTGTLSLAGINENIERILKVTGLGRLFTVYPTLEEARTASILQTA
jgi:anti-sigma B factor antagonist